MASQKTKFSVGLFVLVGMGIALFGILMIGMSSLFQKGDLYVTYFNESVQGLDVDSPVKYRGVSVGRVENIEVAPDSKLIEVVLKIEGVEKIEENIVAQLKNVGITGLMFVELDRIEAGEQIQTLKLDFPTPHHVIPSKPSDISEIMQGIDDVINQVKDLDLGGISARIKTTLDSATDALGRVNQGVAHAEVKELSKGIRETMQDVNRILDPERWNRIVDSVEDAVVSMDELFGNADRTVTTADTALSRVDEIVSEKRTTIMNALDDFARAMGSANRLMEKGTDVAGRTDASIAELRRYLIHTAQNLQSASENLERVTQTLADQPSELLFGDPPPRREVEPEP
ncbi:MAG: MlaD family protein [Deltaproteobacteria bacterium]|nr:MlaD family protein [Deltaproteobacteria bacterium]